MDDKKDDTIDNLCKNADIKNLINLSNHNDINVFDKQKNKYLLKSKKRFLKESENKKKDISIILTLSKLNTTNNEINKEKYIECYSND